MYGKQSECAIATISRLAEVYDGGTTRLSAADIADSRGLPPSYVKKILAVLSHAGLVARTRGPGGGTTLLKEPKTIRLNDVLQLFELSEDEAHGTNHRDADNDVFKYLTHAKMRPVREAMESLLMKTTFEVFQRPGTPEKDRSAGLRGRKGKRKRESYRATPNASIRRRLFRTEYA